MLKAPSEQSSINIHISRGSSNSQWSKYHIIHSKCSGIQHWNHHCVINIHISKLKMSHLDRQARLWTSPKASHRHFKHLWTPTSKIRVLNCLVLHLIVKFTKISLICCPYADLYSLNGKNSCFTTLGLQNSVSKLQISWVAGSAWPIGQTHEAFRHFGKLRLKSTSIDLQTIPQRRKQFFGTLAIHENNQIPNGTDYTSKEPWMRISRLPTWFRWKHTADPNKSIDLPFFAWNSMTWGHEAKTTKSD